MNTAILIANQRQKSLPKAWAESHRVPHSLGIQSIPNIIIPIIAAGEIIAYLVALYFFFSFAVLLQQKTLRIEELMAELETLEATVQQREMILMQMREDTPSGMDKITSMTYLTDERTEVSQIKP